MSKEEFKPFVPAESKVAEFTIKSILLGCIAGIIFGAATVYLALKAGLTVSASIPIAVLAITLGKRFFKTTILENNIIQTTGSAGESIAAGVVFTLPGFLFLSTGVGGQSSGEAFFNYMTILILAILGGILGTLMMIPLRRSLIVKEHENLPYPEGTACASVLQAGEKGGSFARTAFWGLGFSLTYALLQKVFHLVAEAPTWVSKQANKFLPSAQVSGEITPEYMGVGYIIGPKISGILVAGGVLAWLALIPLLSTLIDPLIAAKKLFNLGLLADINKAGGVGGWDPVTHTFADYPRAIYQAFVKQIGAGAVAAGGFITLIKTIPTIISSFKESLGAIKAGKTGGEVKRTDRDLSIKLVGIGSLVLILLMAILPQIPGDSIVNKLLIGVLVIVFGAFFVTVSSRIVGLIGSSNNPISGMTIATIMGTCLVFIAVGWTGKLYEPMALVVGGMICIAAANAGATSQDLKTGYLIGATPKYQQIALFIGAIVSSIMIGITVRILDTPTAEMLKQGIHHAIGTETYAAPQATLMATLIKGILGNQPDWQFIMIGACIAITIELCGINALSFAVGAYLPLSTTLPIFAGGAIKGIVNWREKQKVKTAEEEEIAPGNLFATGLVAGGAIAGVIVAILMVIPAVRDNLSKVNIEPTFVNWFGQGGYEILGVLFFLFMGFVLYNIGIKKQDKID
ncbi:OPT/YSL family transporter [Pedobacter sp. KR3-3]|uniref:OPT/YSL family transporter n=1 Tax=Pedobacter albus TaxID=3113905 RepID=A0ABU7I484_9SPHI|nr:OPT/YSL family transporter [Pedobacter sp. KR3-3]MEE1944264.1 OPT/YSL family transporter [Pedobacter sp. KR3-3]